ncbi:MAG: NAD(P)H-hydrate dehydratase [Bacteroidales bacterium]
MKILSVEQIREADKYTIDNEPIESDQLMERAAKAVFIRMTQKLSFTHRILVFCGTGNNGGDGLALARMLHLQGFEVETFLVMFSEKLSDDCALNLKRLKEINGTVLHEIREKVEIPAINNSFLIVDALFGSGLNKAIKGLAAEVIKMINSSDSIIISIDIPSGLKADSLTDHKKELCVKADYTLSFEFPKLAFLFPENELFVGNWEVLPIGLHPGFIQNLPVQNNLLTSEMVSKIVHKRAKFSHKGTYGHALLIAGSAGKSGAAILASLSCLHSGAGLLHTHLPKSAVIPLQVNVPEAMISCDPDEDYFSQKSDIAAFNAIGIGPGLGTEEKSAHAFKLLIQDARVPLIIDADALNILSENKTWLAFLPKNTILTPHPKEFERLFGKTGDSFERMEVQRSMSVKYGFIIVLKGAHTCISMPDGSCWFNSTGNPGMATGGSGDVLTGLILGLLAQGYSTFEASVLGVFLHGLAGDIAVSENGMESLIAGDIVRNIGKAYMKLNPAI